jgi:hypothetical protein
MEKKYTVLRVIATLYKIAGVLVALGTVLFVIIIIVSAAALNQYLGLSFDNSPIWTFLGVIITFLSGGLAALGIYAIGEALYLLIGLEENTRFTAILLRDRFYPQPQSSPLPPQQPMAPPQQPRMPPQQPMTPPQQPMMPPQQPMMPPQQPMTPPQQPMSPPQQPTNNLPPSNPPYTPA